MKRRGLVYDAAIYDLPPCPRCDAFRGDPCRRPSGRRTDPHAERRAIHRQEVDAEALEILGPDEDAEP